MKTPEEITAELKKLGVNIGAWGEAPNGGTEVKLSAVDRQKESLLKLRAVLEGMVEKDRQATLLLRQQLIRLDHGGGS